MINILSLLIVLAIVSCSKKEAEFLTLPVAEEDLVYQTNYYVAIAGGDTNHRGVALYDEQGNLVDLIKHYRSPTELGTPRGLIQFDNDNLLVALDNTDRIENINLDTFTNSSFFSGGTLSGNIYDIGIDSLQNIYAIESNVVEKFDMLGNQTTPVYINTTVGSCTLNNPRQLVINSSNEMLITSYSNNRILHYDISSTTSSCLTSTVVANNPYGIMVHSNGSIYYNTWSDDQIYRANADGSGGVVVFATNTTILNNPTAMVELPNGNILVASSNTDSVEEFAEDGTYIGTFILDTQSLNITDMVIITREELVE
ncbi:MAG: hypothetical protein KDD58_06960 [Bdellovibrionales bacterium]|nr:hypothetical protein [Bdellovibrionales bacterium]